VNIVNVVNIAGGREKKTRLAIPKRENYETNSLPNFP
jgi:hypothetical protein